MLYFERNNIVINFSHFWNVISMFWRLNPLKNFRGLPCSEDNLLSFPVMTLWKFLDFSIIWIATFLKIVVLRLVLLKSVYSIIVLCDNDFHFFKETNNYPVKIFEILRCVGISTKSKKFLHSVPKFINFFVTAIEALIFLVFVTFLIL